MAIPGVTAAVTVAVVRRRAAATVFGAAVTIFGRRAASAAAGGDIIAASAAVAAAIAAASAATATTASAATVVDRAAAAGQSAGVDNAHLYVEITRVLTVAPTRSFKTTTHTKYPPQNCQTLKPVIVIGRAYRSPPGLLYGTAAREVRPFYPSSAPGRPCVRKDVLYDG